jgi:hypothetical protein
MSRDTPIDLFSFVFLFHKADFNLNKDRELILMTEGAGLTHTTDMHALLSLTQLMHHIIGKKITLIKEVRVLA